MTDYQVVDLGGMEVTETTPVVAGPRGANGTDGASAYEVAVANGFVGTEAEWLASLAAGGAVSSVNGEAGDVVLSAADIGALPDTYVPAYGDLTGKPSIPDSADDIGAETPAGAQAKVDAHAADTTGVHGIADTSLLATTADVSAASTADRARGNHTGTQTSATISDFTEAVQDAVAALLTSGTNVTLTYNDAGNSLTVTAATGGDAEMMRDTIGAALVGVGNIAVTVNDAADTITISTTATVNSTDAALRDRSTHTGTQSAATITGLEEAVAAAIPFGRFRGEWATDILVRTMDLASSIPPEMTALTAGAGATPVWAGTPIVGGAPAGLLGYITMNCNNINGGNRSFVRLSLAALGISNITRVKAYFAMTGGGFGQHPEFTQLAIYKNGSVVTAVTPPSGGLGWTELVASAASSDTLEFHHDGAYIVDSSNTNNSQVAGIRIYATPDPYMTADYVAYQGKMWRSDVDNNNATPGSANWTEVPIGAPALNQQTGTAYTLAASDASKLLTLTNASPVTVTVPTFATVGLLVGSKVQVANLGAGAVTLSPASGVTIQKESAASFTLAQYQGGSLTKTATDTWVWQPSVAAGGSSSALTVQDENANVSTAVTQIDFQGAGVTVTNGTGEVVVNIPGISGGSGAVSTYNCRVYRGTAFTFASSTFTAVPFTAASYDAQGMWSSGSPTRVTIKEDGKYEAVGQLSADAQTAACIIQIKKNGTTLISQGAITAQTTSCNLGVADVIPCVVGDYLELIIYSAHSGTRSLNYADANCYFAVAKVGT